MNALLAVAGLPCLGRGRPGRRAGWPGPVQLNLPLRDPLVPGLADPGLAPAAPGEAQWPEPLHGRPDGAPWTRLPARADPGPALAVPWTERGVIVCGDGTADPAALLGLAAEAGWPVLAEPSSGARQGPHALSAYPYLLGHAGFIATHQPDLIIWRRAALGCPAGSSPFLRPAAAAAGPLPAGGAHSRGRAGWADPARSANGVVGRRPGGPRPTARFRLRPGWRAGSRRTPRPAPRWTRSSASRGR